jgi:hypothetical protein
MRQVVGMDREGVREWLTRIIDRYPSTRAASLALGLSHSALPTIMERGQANADTLVSIADAAGVPRLDALRAAGWLREEDIVTCGGAITAEEREWLEAYRALEPVARRAVLRAALELRGLRQGV